MRKKHFKLGMVVLVGLAGYFLALSAVLVASAGIPDGIRFGASAGKIPHLHKEHPRKRTANIQPSGKSSPHGSGFDSVGTGKNIDNPCLSSLAACSDAFNQNTSGSAAWNGQGTGDSIVTNGRGSPFGDRNFGYPASYGFNLFGAGGTISGSFGDTGENGGSSQRGDDGGAPGTGGTPLGFTVPDPGISGLPNEPNIVISPPISEFFPSDPPGSGDPGPSSDIPASDPAPPSGPSGTYSIPEPSTFWLFLASLTALVMALRPIRRLDPRR